MSLEWFSLAGKVACYWCSAGYWACHRRGIRAAGATTCYLRSPGRETRHTAIALTSPGLMRSSVCQQMSRMPGRWREMVEHGLGVTVRSIFW